MKAITARRYAREEDGKDPLRHFRRRFVVADPELIYLDGNSLGRLPLKTTEVARELIEQQWGNRLIRSWNEGWFTAPERIAAKVARLLGADPDEVILADSTSINLFKLVLAALRYQNGRHQILTDNLNFPSDLYIIQGVIDLLNHQHELTIVESSDGIAGPQRGLQEALTQQTALLTLSHTAFKSGYTYEMRELTMAAHAVGSLVLWDLSHSVGAVPLELQASEVDLAIGCTYKYLNGGPGSPAFLFVRRGLQEELFNPISGWMGQQNPFDFDLRYTPNEGLRRFLTGTPQMASLALIEPGVDLLLEAGIDALRRKAVAQTEYLITLWEAWLEPLGFTLDSPRSAARRGSHVTLGHADGWRINRALIDTMNVLPDFRAPRYIRFGIAPIYTSFEDICTAIERLKLVVEEERYRSVRDDKVTVT